MAQAEMQVIIRVYNIIQSAFAHGRGLAAIMRANAAAS